MGNLLLLEKLPDVNRDFCNSGLSLICAQNEKDTLYVFPSGVVGKALDRWVRMLVCMPVEAFEGEFWKHQEDVITSG